MHLICWKIAFLGIEIAGFEKHEVFRLADDEGEEDECNKDDVGVEIAKDIVMVILKSKDSAWFGRLFQT